MSKTFRNRIYDNITQTIGQTPLVRLHKLEKTYNLHAQLIAKLEFFNPLASVKDRIALNMIERAEQKGLISPGANILIEPTSGNTGIGLAFVAAAKGYQLILTMPESVSIERRKMISHLGAKLILTPASGGMKAAIDKAQQLLASTPNSFTPSQFTNPANPEAHRNTTAEEIWHDTNGGADILVAGVGTGGTITGVSQVLKARKASFKTIAVEPTASPVLSGGAPGPHKIQGIGAGFIPDILDMSLIDQIIQINDDDAINSSRELARLEGIPAGISSGAAINAAIKVAQDQANIGKQIIIIIPSFAERYLSTALFQDAE
jgi:cysteine synthase A